MLTNFKDFAVADVSTGYDTSAVAITLTAGHGANLPAAPFFAYWWNSTDYASPDLDPNRELIIVGTRATDALSNITRGAGDDAASTKNTGGKTYKLMATVSARELDSRSRMIHSYGPSSTLVWATTGVEFDVTPAAFTIPANFLKAGDLLEIDVFWQHLSGFVASPRLGLKWSGSSGYLYPLIAQWGATETTFAHHIKAHIRDVGAAGVALVRAFGFRENGSFSFGASNVQTLDTTAAITITPSYRFDASGETIAVGKISVVLHRY